MPFSAPLTRYRESDLPEGHPHRTENYAHLGLDTWDEPDYKRHPHTHPNIARHYGLIEVRPPHPDLKQSKKAVYTYPAHSYTLVPDVASFSISSKCVNQADRCSLRSREGLVCQGKVAHVAKYKVSPNDRKATLGCCSRCSRGSGAGPCDVKGATIEWRDEGEGPAPIVFPVRQPAMVSQGSARSGGHRSAGSCTQNGLTGETIASSERIGVKQATSEGSNAKQGRNKRRRSWSQQSETASECLARREWVVGK